jgi:hypothetical protein
LFPSLRGYELLWVLLAVQQHTRGADKRLVDAFTEMCRVRLRELGENRRRVFLVGEIAVHIRFHVRAAEQRKLDEAAGWKLHAQCGLELVDRGRIRAGNGQS